VKEDPKSHCSSSLSSHAKAHLSEIRRGSEDHPSGGLGAAEPIREVHEESRETLTKYNTSLEI
jgi:hypothetical protein